MKRIPELLRLVGGLIVVAIIGGVAFLTREQWLPLLTTASVEASSEEVAQPVEDPKVLKLSAQARKNLGLISRPARPQTYWRKIQVPGAIVDRPGRSDRGVTSPAVGVVLEVHAFPGETVRPGDRLFTLRLFSEYLQNTQKELFSSNKEIELIQEQLDRLRPLAESGGIPKTKIIELENQLRRQETVIQAYRQDLLTRGLSPTDIQKVAEGEFISTIDVVAPPAVKLAESESRIQLASFQPVNDESMTFAYEVQ